MTSGRGKWVKCDDVHLLSHTWGTKAGRLCVEACLGYISWHYLRKPEMANIQEREWE